MLYRISFLLISAVICNSSMAAYIITDTRSGSTLIKRTETYANSAGDLRVDERGYGSSASTSSEAGTGSVTTNFHLGKIQDTFLFQSKDQAIVSLEGNICRRMTADSAPPPGLGASGMNLGDANKKMADAMKQANAAMEQAMKQARKEGMTADQERALKQFTQPFTETQTIKPRNTLEIYALNERTSVGEYSAQGFGVRDIDGNEKQRIWVVPMGDVAGGAQVRNAMLGMYKTYEKYLDKMGGGALMDTSLAGMFEKPELADKYPVRIEDLESGEVTDIVEAHSSDRGAVYYPDCEERNMFGQ